DHDLLGLFAQRLFSQLLLHPRPRPYCYGIYLFKAPATTNIYTLSLHDALPISPYQRDHSMTDSQPWPRIAVVGAGAVGGILGHRSEEHTSELQSLAYLVCRLLLEKKKQNIICKVVRHLAKTVRSRVKAIRRIWP